MKSYAENIYSSDTFRTDSKVPFLMIGTRRPMRKLTFSHLAYLNLAVAVNIHQEL